MAKKVEVTDPFQSGLDNADEQLYGAVDIGTSSRLDRVKRIDIFSLFPDPTQPRRIVPSEMRSEWPPQMPDFLVSWIARAKLDIPEYVHLAEDKDRPNETDPIKAGLMELADLALSIQQGGLANPITVIREGANYRIETGERRWMAYHLLNLFEPEQWDKIPARVMDQSDVWRQAAENNARSNLNAISKSRQFALLLMDLLRREKKRKFRPLAEFENEQDFYAQIVEDSPPSGTSGILMNGLGVSHRSAITRYRALLRLPSELWKVGDDHNWGLVDLYRLSQLPDETAKAEACRLARTQGLTLPWCGEEKPDKPDLSIMDRFHKGWRGFVNRQRRLARWMDDGERLQVATLLRQLADEMEEKK